MPVIKAAIHYGNDTKEHVLNNAPEAVLRELISNAYDAAAEKIHFGPLIYYNEKIRDRCNPPPKKHGFFFMDNGAGMTNASANADPSESQGTSEKDSDRKGSWMSFICKGMSSKGGRADMIGHKGQGTKLLLNCDKKLIVISRSEGDRNWGCWYQDAPVDTMFDHRSPECTIDLKDREACYNEFKGVIEEASKYCPDDEMPRWTIHLLNKVKHFLEQNSGTLVVALGLMNKGLCKDLGELDKWSEKDKPDDYDFLYWFMRLKTVLGDPFFETTLKKGGFNLEDFKNMNKKEKKDEKHVPEMHILTKGSDNDKSNFKFRELERGFPYARLASDAERYVQRGTDDDRRQLKVDYDPRRTKNWNDAKFQDRHLGSFQASVGSKTCSFEVALAVDGNRTRLNTFSMLNRRGGNAYEQKRCGIPLTDFYGLTLYSKGVYVSNDNDLWSGMDKLFGDKFAADDILKKCMHLVVDGDFEVQSNRNDIISNVKTALKDSRDEGFLRKLEELLEGFTSKEDGSRTIFGMLVDRVKQEARQKDTDTVQAAYEKKVANLKRMMRCEINLEPKLKDKSSLLPKKLQLFIPESGPENQVINVYKDLSQIIPYIDCPNNLKEFWPRIIFLDGGEGTDAFGMSQKNFSDQSRWTSTVDNSIADKDRLSIEFKANFTLPTQRDKNVFNHAFNMVDFIICWKLNLREDSKLKKDSDGRIDLPESLVHRKVYDSIQCHGTLHWTDDIRGDIPEELKGHCFYIKDINNRDGHQQYKPDAPVRETRSTHILIVVELEHLMKATFGEENIKDYPAATAASAAHTVKKKRNKETNRRRRK